MNEPRLFTAPPVDGVTPDDMKVRVAGSASDIVRPMRFGDQVTLLVRGTVGKVGQSFQMVDGDRVPVRTVTVEPDFTYLLDQRGPAVDSQPFELGADVLAAAVKESGVAGLIDVAAAAAMRDRDVRDGRDPLPLDTYRADRAAGADQ